MNSPEQNQTPESTETATAATGADVSVEFDNTVDKVSTKFNFRKVKDEATGVETKRATVELDLPLLTVEGVVAAMKSGGKQLELVIEACRQFQLDRAREIVNDNVDISAANFPWKELTWEAIANLPKAERRGGGIPKETWEDFSKDYVAVMPTVTGKSAEQIANAAKILLNKFQQAKTNKPVLALLKEQLGIYANSSPNAEQFSDCISFLVEKADVFLKMDDAQLLANL